MSGTDHERNVLVWLAASPQRWLVLLVALVILSLTWGCGHAPITASSSPTTEKERLAVALVNCHVEYHQTSPIEVVFHDSRRRQDEAHAWADYLARQIHVARPSLESWAPVDIEMVMGHEVAHILGFVNEDQATLIASMAYYNAGCH